MARNLDEDERDRNPGDLNDLREQNSTLSELLEESQSKCQMLEDFLNKVTTPPVIIKSRFRDMD